MGTVRRRLFSSRIKLNLSYGHRRQSLDFKTRRPPTGFAKMRSTQYLELSRNDKLPVTTANRCDATRDEFARTKTLPQRSSRFFVNANWTERSHVKKILCPKPKRKGLLKVVDGSVITNDSRQMTKQVEHIVELYSRPVSIQPKTLALIPNLATCNELDATPTTEELHFNIKQIKGRSGFT